MAAVIGRPPLNRPVEASLHVSWTRARRREPRCPFPSAGVQIPITGGRFLKSVIPGVPFISVFNLSTALSLFPAEGK